MNSKIIILLIVIATFSNSICKAQEQVIYKTVDSTNLYMDIFYPEQISSSNTKPAMVFFFGGGWINGSRSHFLNHAKYFSKRGIACFLVDYRIKSKHNTSPIESLKDAKSAIRFIRKNASKFGVDPQSIIAAGGSAGGHLAASTALIEDYNEHTDDLSISCVPNALVLFNPVIDNGPNGYGYERIRKEYKRFSPIHNIKEGAPPTIIFLGTKDHLIPTETAFNYQNLMRKVKSRCELKLYKGQGHGFFNYSNSEYYKKTVLEADIFLQSLGYLN